MLVSGHIDYSLVLTDIVSVVNFIKTRHLSDEMGAEHSAVLFHSKARWLLRGKVLLSLFFKVFLEEQRVHEVASKFSEDF